MDKITQEIGSLQAACFSNTAMLLSLGRALIQAGVITKEDFRRSADDALLRLEEMQAAAPETERWVFEIARKHVEVFVAPMPRKGG